MEQPYNQLARFCGHPGWLLWLILSSAAGPRSSTPPVAVAWHASQCSQSFNLSRGGSALFAGAVWPCFKMLGLPGEDNASCKTPCGRLLTAGPVHVDLAFAWIRWA